MVTVKDSADSKLLNFVYQNSAMGIQSINQLLDIVENDQLLSQLQRQLDGYYDFHKEARARLNAMGYDDKGLSSLEKIKTSVMVGMQAMMDKSPSHIAEMMILGSNMGILDAEKKLNHFPSASEDTKRLMEKLLKFEEDNVQKLKAYL